MAKKSYVNKIRKSPKLMIASILLIIFFFSLMISIASPQTAFGSKPRITHTFDKLGLMNLTNINIDNINKGKLTFIGCESTNLAIAQQPIPAKFFIHYNKIAEFNFPNRCIENNMQRPKQLLETEVDLQKEYFTIFPNLTLEKGSQDVEFRKFEVTERVECLKNTDCASITRLSLGMCNPQHECQYNDEIPIERPPQGFWEKIIAFFSRLFRMKAI